MNHIQVLDTRAWPGSQIGQHRYLHTRSEGSNALMMELMSKLAGLLEVSITRTKIFLLRMTI